MRFRNSAWVPHATGFPGNEAVRLVTVMGQPTDAFEGPMRPTEHLARCPYIMEVMAELGGVWGRSRLMGLGAGAEVPEHVDAHYHWRTHLRIHIPMITNPQVEFTCGGETVHMAPGRVLGVRQLPLARSPQPRQRTPGSPRARHSRHRSVCGT